MNPAVLAIRFGNPLWQSALKEAFAPSGGNFAETSSETPFVTFFSGLAAQLLHTAKKFAIL